jgi:hypothetical protein
MNAVIATICMLVRQLLNTLTDYLARTATMPQAREEAVLQVAVASRKAKDIDILVESRLGQPQMRLASK